MTHWRLALGLAAVAGYAFLSHLLMVRAPEAPWAVAVILGPLLLAVLAWAAQRRDRLAWLVLVAGVLALAAVVQRGGVGDVARLYVLQHAGVHLALALTFGLTLRAPPGRSMIGLLAARLHRLTPAMELYTHAVTRVWSAYFLAMTAASIAIYALLPWSAWSLFANLVTPLAAVALFVGEHRMRYRLHPEFERMPLAAGWRAWQQHDGRPADAGSRR